MDKARPRIITNIYNPAFVKGARGGTIYDPRHVAPAMTASPGGRSKPTC